MLATKYLAQSNVFFPCNFLTGMSRVTLPNEKGTRNRKCSHVPGREAMKYFAALGNKYFLLKKRMNLRDIETKLKY